jgi:hypothetical protein
VKYDKDEADRLLEYVRARVDNGTAFFRLDDNGCVFYHLVALDLDGAKALLRASGSTFGSAETSLDAAEGLTWTELTPAEVVKIARCHTEDDRGVIALSDARVGDWFCSEW